MLTAIVICVLIGAVAPQEFSCPKDDNLICIDGFFSHEYNCSWYYECLNCQKSLKECTEGNHFDDTLNFCRDYYLAECDPAYTRNGSAFCVYFNSSRGNMDGPINPLVFDNSFVNYKFPFDPDTGYWRASHTGHFFFHMSAGVCPGVKMNNSLAGTPFAWNNVRESTHHEADIVARDMIMTLSYKFTVASIIPEGNCMGNDDGNPSLWAGFEIEEFDDDVIAFFAISNVYHRNNAAPTTIVFEDQMFDIHDTDDVDYYHTGTGQFVAPKAGTYFFMFSTGMEAFQDHRSRFLLNSATPLAELYREVGHNTGKDTLSKSVVCNMAAGDTMEIQLVSGQSTNNQSTMLSYGGFLIDPKPPTPRNIWFVTTHLVHTGPENPMVFENREINIGSLFNPLTNTIEINTNGFYYMNVYSGLSASEPITLELLKVRGGVTELLLNLRRSPGYQTGIDTMSRAVLVHLRAGDTVHLGLAAGTSYSNANAITTFSGWMIYNIEEP